MVELSCFEMRDVGVWRPHTLCVPCGKSRNTIAVQCSFAVRCSVCIMRCGAVRCGVVWYCIVSYSIGYSNEE